MVERLHRTGSGEFRWVGIVPMQWVGVRAGQKLIIKDRPRIREGKIAPARQREDSRKLVMVEFFLSERHWSKRN
jgi:hypothetical protein